MVFSWSYLEDPREKRTNWLEGLFLLSFPLCPLGFCFPFSFGLMHEKIPFLLLQQGCWRERACVQSSIFYPDIPKTQFTKHFHIQFPFCLYKSLMNIIPPSFKIGKLKQTTYIFCSSNLFDCKKKKPIQASEGKYYISISFKYPHQPLGLHCGL